MTNWKKEVLTVPNVLSLARLLLIPVYMRIYLRAESDADYYLAAAILAVSCLTDAIDGLVARKYHMISQVGKVLDPLADKATQLSLFLCQAIRHPVLWIAAALFTVKECYQLIAGLIFLQKGKMLSGALVSGKLCTCILFVNFVFLVLFPNIQQDSIYMIAGLDCVAILWAMAAYIHVYATDSPLIEDLNA